MWIWITIAKLLYATYIIQTIELFDIIALDHTHCSTNIKRIFSIKMHNAHCFELSLALFSHIAFRIHMLCHRFGSPYSPHQHLHLAVVRFAIALYIFARLFGLFAYLQSAADRSSIGTRWGTLIYKCDDRVIGSYGTVRERHIYSETNICEFGKPSVQMFDGILHTRAIC